MKIQIPFHIIELDPGNFHIYVTLNILNRDVNLLIDTGASQSVIDRECKDLVRSTSERLKKQFTDSGYSINSEIKEFGSGIIPEIFFHKKKIGDLNVILIDLNYINTLYRKYTDIKINGLLGCDFLVKFNAVINFTGKTVTLWRE